MNYGSLVPSFYYYKFADAVTQPYTSFNAYRSGAIDERGNLLKPESSLDSFEYFVIKLKKIFEQLPPGLTKYQLSSYAATLNMFAEEAESFNIPSDHFVALVEGWLATNIGPSVSYIELLEDMGSANLGGPASSPGYNTGAVSGNDMPMAPVQRRKRPVSDETFHMFDVSENDFSRITNNQMNEIEYLRRFGIRNPESTLVVRNKKDGNLYNVPKRKKLKEQFNLYFLENAGAVAAYDDANDKPGEPSVAVLTDKEEAKKAKAKAQKKGYVRPPVSPGTTHEQRFRENMAELVRLHGEAIGGGRHGHAAEYEAKMMFHAKAYHELKDTPHIHGYMDTVHQGIISPVSATDRSGKGGDVHVPSIADDKLKIEPVEVKTRGASSKRVMPVSLMQHLLDTVPDAMSAWAKAIPGRQRFLFPKGDPEGAEERFRQAKTAIEQSQDPVIVKGREESAAKLRQRTSGRTLIKNSDTGRFHFVNPQAQAPEVTMGQQWGQGPKTMGKEVGRHQVGYRANYNRPPEDSEVFSISKDVQDTMLAHVDPEHHEHLRKLSDVHIG